MPETCCVLDNTASVLTKRGGFRRREQSLFRLPVLIVDSGTPALSSTNTLSVQVCDCDADGVPQACGAVAYSLPAGLSTGALLAILGCILTLLGKTQTRQRTSHINTWNSWSCGLHSQRVHMWLHPSNAFL